MPQQGCTRHRWGRRSPATRSLRSLNDAERRLWIGVYRTCGPLLLSDGVPLAAFLRSPWTHLARIARRQGGAA